MKAKVNINGKDVEVTLTQSQIKEAKKAAVTITDKVKTFDDAVKLVGISADLKSLVNYKGRDKDMITASAYAKLVIIARALNEGWVPDFTDGNQIKYWPWLKFTKGAGFSFLVYGDVWSDSAVGSRLCYKSRELATYAAKQFQPIYNQYFK